MEDFPRVRSEFRAWMDARNKEIQEFNQNRINTYGPVGKQLDLLWHDIDDGVIPGKGGRFHAYVERVKNLVTKPDFDIQEYQDYDFSQHEFIEDLD